MGNVHRSWLVVGVVNAIVAFGVLFYWNSSAADDTPADSSADSTVASLAADGTSAQAAKSTGGSAEKPDAKKPATQPTATSHLLSASDDDEQIRKALGETVQLDFSDTPLGDALDKISKQHGIRIWIDQRALTDLNITSDTPVTRKLSDVSLKSALQLLLRPLQLAFRVHDGVLQITSQAEYDNKLEVRVYPVGDIVAPFNKPEARDQADFDALIDVISNTIAPTSWDTVGGPGSMGPHVQSLIVSQTADVHEQIEGLVRTLRSVQALQRKALGGAGVDILSDERSAAIGRTLKNRIDWDFSDTPLRDALEFIAKKGGMQVQIDERALTDLNIASETPVTSNLGGIPLKDALDLLLQPLQLTFVIDDEVLLITSRAEADNLLQVRVYPVGDVLDCESGKQGVNASSCDFDSLIDVITTTVAPTTWDDVGGPSSVGSYESALALVIAQTQEVHEIVDSLLSRLRQAQGAERKKSAATGAADDKSELTTRVYALWQFGPQRERHFGNAPVNPAASPASERRRLRAQAASLAQFGGGLGGGLPPSGFGGEALSENDFSLVPPPGVAAEQAASIIRRFVEPESWKQPGVVLQAAPHRLVIRQTAAIHKKTEEFLQQLGPWRDVNRIVVGSGLGGAAQFGGAFQVADDPFGSPAKRTDDRDPFAPPAGPAADPFAAPAQEKSRPPATATAEAKAAKAHIPAAPHLPTAAEARIRVELSQPIEFEFNETPLRDAIQYLKDQHGIEIQIDEKELTESGVKRDAPVTLAVKGVSLRSALRLLLSQVSNSATFVVADEVLLITTREGARKRTSVRIYDVSDFAEPQVAVGGDPFGPQAPAPPPYAAGPQSGVHGLVNVIERAIAPGTWGADHGSGVVPLVRNDSALLVVHHSAGVHDEIVDLLSSLREMRKRGRRAER
jgi:hypothetical protein